MKLLLLQVSYWICSVSSHERPIAVVFDGRSAYCGASYTGYSFTLSMQCLTPQQQKQQTVLPSFSQSSSQTSPAVSNCSVSFVSPWAPGIPKMFILAKITHLQIPAGSRLKIFSVSPSGFPYGDPEVDIRFGSLDHFKKQHGSEYIQLASNVRIEWQSNNPIIHRDALCVPYALSFQMRLTTFWPRWVNQTSKAFECPMGSFLCRRVHFCLPKQFVGDGVEQCVDGDDEMPQYVVS